MSTKKTILKTRQILRKQGKEAYEIAKETILKEKLEYAPIREALDYFMKNVWRNYQHPALLSLICESVGGNPEAARSVGASLVLMTGAADIHDDIIDKSLVKASKKTVLGKFGLDIAILVGDALLFEGCALLNEACQNLPEEERKAVLDLVKEGFFELGAAEAKEASYRGNWQLTPEEYFEIIRVKAAIAGMTARVGAVLGHGSPRQVEALGEYGRIMGMLMNVRDEFVDVYESRELKNRIDNECLPLPVLYVFRNATLRKKIICVFEKGKLTDKDALALAKMMMETKEAKNLKNEMKSLLKKGLVYLRVVKEAKQREALRTLLFSALEDL
jgi:geranylgeranyl pyrophosphate synthase